MMAMSRAPGRRGERRAGRKARGALRSCAAVWLVFHIAYTPIHLCLEPHCDVAHVGTGPAPVHAGDFVAGNTHDGDDHQHRHCAEQHESKVAEPTRAMVAERTPAQLAEWANPLEGCPQRQRVSISGLSPPEFSCSWRFLLRAALPVRAPSVLG